MVLKYLSSSKGNAMTTSLMVTGGAAAISAFLFAQSISTDRATKLPRIKSAMNQVEVSLRSMVLQPSSFTCTQVGATEKVDCTVNLAGLNSLERELPGADAGARCKIAIQDAGIGTVGNATVNGSPFIATLKYTCSSDKDAERVAAQKISIDIPGEITSVTSSTFTCADIDINKPILVGFNSTGGAGSSGGIKCVSMKSSCAANEYVTSIDQATMKVNCSPLSTAAIAESSSNVLGGIIWKGPNITAGPSVARKNPSSIASLGPMFVTSPSSSTATVLAKPSAVATGGACTCDSATTTCWDGSVVCPAAGEACSAAPASPTPIASPASSPVASPIVSPLASVSPAASPRGGSCTPDSGTAHRAGVKCMAGSFGNNCNGAGPEPYCQCDGNPSITFFLGDGAGVICPPIPSPTPAPSPVASACPAGENSVTCIDNILGQNLSGYPTCLSLSAKSCYALDGGNGSPGGLTTYCCPLAAASPACVDSTWSPATLKDFGIRTVLQTSNCNNTRTVTQCGPADVCFGTDVCHTATRASRPGEPAERDYGCCPLGQKFNPAWTLKPQCE